MKNDTNIIAIYNKNQAIALNEFKTLVSNTSHYLNAKAQKENKYKECTSKQLEIEVLEALKNSCTKTLFKPEDIELISGQHFPDIIAGKHFGVEVKSTKENRWTSTGSSIIESTRIPNIDHIYMMFGKLGGTPVEFRCKPYEECLYDIAVTHSPRYLIDMDITPEKTIFHKMGIDYNSFRALDNSIGFVRNYYINKAKETHRSEMPWWLNSESISAPTVTLWERSTFTIEEQNRLKSELLILFPYEICSSNYSLPTLWLCTRHSIINTHFRDLFTSGGRVKIEKTNCPAIIKRILNLSSLISHILTTEDLIYDMEIYNHKLYESTNKLETWKDQIQEMFPQYKDLKIWIEKNI